MLILEAKSQPESENTIIIIIYLKLLCIYTAVHNLVSVIFLYFKEVSSPHQGCIYLIENTGRNMNIIRT